MQNRFFTYLVTSIVLFLSRSSLPAETVWLEAETAKSSTMQIAKEDPATFSGGQWLHGNSHTLLTADIDTKVNDGGKYTFFVRRCEMGGAFRWHFDDQPWVVVDDVIQNVVGNMNTKYGSLAWINLGFANLAPGAHTLHLETNPPAVGKPDHGYSFDCFVLSNDGFVPKDLDPAGGPKTPEIKISEDDFGKLLPRTMALLESATPTHHTPIYILCYGQSIIGICHIDVAIQKYLHQKYPYADIKMKNLAIGGYQAPILRKTSWQDLYPENPDLLIFHDYGGENGELDEIFQGIHSNMTTEVLTWTHHVDCFNYHLQEQSDSMCNIIRGLSTKYGFELAEVRPQWKDYLRTNHLPPGALLADMIHLNGKGTELITSLLIPHFRDNANASTEWQKHIHTIPLSAPCPEVTFDSSVWTQSPDGLVSSGTAPLKLQFTGNRVDLVSLPSSTGSAKILLDGKAPSTIPDTLAATRSTPTPGTWGPAVSRVILGPNVVPEHYKMTFHDVSPDGASFAFDLAGSVTGPDGSGKSDADFTSKSGNITIKADDFGWDRKKKPGKPFPAQFVVEWDLYSMESRYVEISHLRPCRKCSAKHGGSLLERWAALAGDRA